MAKKIFLHLLILCGIWSQGFIEISATEEIRQSSDIVGRQKRVVSHYADEDIPVGISSAPHVVRIMERRRNKCTGSIVSKYVAITAVACVLMEAENYQVVTSSTFTNHGNNHFVKEIRRRIGDPHLSTIDGVALLLLNPLTPFVYSIYCHPIRLHTGPVLIGSLAKVSGWGYNPKPGNHGTNIPMKLRSIEVPVISHQDCANRYRPHLLSEKNICTYHPQRHNGHTDIGAGLVIDGTLAGVFLWSGLYSQIDRQYPDVYAYFHDTHYNQWIRTNIQGIDLYYESQQHS